MSENDDTAPDVPEAPAPPRPAATRWTETLWTFRSVVAVALASLLVGGAGGALIVAATDDEGPDHPRVRIIDGDGPGFRHGPFRDGGPRWYWDDGQQPPQPQVPSTPRPSTPTPSQ